MLAVLTNQITDIQHFNDKLPYTIEEADKRIFLHGKNVAQSNSKILIKTINSDVVVIAIVSHCTSNLDELWVEFWRGKHQTMG